MDEEIIDRMYDVLRFSGIPLGRLFGEFVEQIGYERLQYMHDQEFIKLLENYYNE